MASDASHEDAIAQFAMITAYEDTSHIASLLEQQKWDLEMAMNIFFSRGMPAECKAGAEPVTIKFDIPIARPVVASDKPSELRAELKVRDCTFEIRQGDLTREVADCLVNPANNRLKHGAGIAAELVRRGGEVIQDLSDIHIAQSGTLEDGQVVATNAGNLQNCKQILHAVGPTWQGGQMGEEMLLALTVTNVLEQTFNLGYDSVVLPAISSGIFGFPKPRSCQVIFQAAVSYVEKNPHTLRTIKFMANDNETVRCFENVANDKISEDNRQNLRRKRLESRKRRFGPFRVLCLGDNHTLGFHGVDKHTMYGLGSQNNGDEATAKYVPYSLRLSQLITKHLESSKLSCEFVTCATNGAQASSAMGAVAELEAKEKLNAGDIKDQNPAFSVVIVWLGTNDLLCGAPARQVFTDIKALHERLCSADGLNCCTSAVCLLPPFDLSEWVPRWGAKQVSDAAKAEINDNRAKLNALLRDWARDTKRPLVNLDTAIFQDATQSIMWDDAIHYTPNGYRKLGDVIFHVLDACELFDL